MTIREKIHQILAELLEESRKQSQLPVHLRNWEKFDKLKEMYLALTEED